MEEGEEPFTDKEENSELNIQTLVRRRVRLNKNEEYPEVS